MAESPMTLQYLSNIFVFLYDFPTVNSIQWAPHEWGLILACGSSDESFSIISTSGQFAVRLDLHVHTVEVIMWY